MDKKHEYYCCACFVFVCTGTTWGLIKFCHY